MQKNDSTKSMHPDNAGPTCTCQRAVSPELLKKHWFHNKKRGARASGLNAGNANGAKLNAKTKKLRVLVDIKDIVDT